MKLREKLMFTLLPLLILACLAAGLSFYSSLDSELSRELKINASESASSSAKAIQNHIEQSLRDLELLSIDDALPALLTKKGYRSQMAEQQNFVNAFKQLKGAKSSLEEFYLLNPEGKLVTNYASDAFYLPKKDWDWLYDLYDTVMVKDGFNAIKKTQHGMRMVYLRKITNKDNTSTLGTLIVTENLDFLKDNTMSEHYLYINDSLGVLNQTSSVEDSFYPSLQLNNKQKWFESEGAHWFSSQSPVAFGQLYVFISAQDYMSSTRDLKIQVTTMTIVFTLFFSVFIGIMINRMFLTPLKKACVATAAIKNGDYDVNLRYKRNGNDEMGELFRGITTMAKTIKQKNIEVQKLAYYDPLTELHNKSYFLDFVKSQPASRGDKTLVVISFDLDNFKQINEINGYETGNQVLKAVASKLFEAGSNYLCRHQSHNDEYTIARSAGAEFLVACYLPEDDRHANSFIDKLKQSISNSFWVSGREFSLGSFAGWCRADEHTSAYDTYSRADMAMHEAKSTRANSLKFHHGLLERIVYNQTMSDDINYALETDQFTLYYQPKQNIITNKAVEFEALIRWTHPTKGFISPGDFIPFAEDMNLIKDIDYWVVSKAISDVQALEANGWRDFVVSFNVSGNRLSDDVFLALIKSELNRSKISPEHLQVEITEHSLICDIEQSIESIKALRALGVGVSLDDFGTGHSSLGYLQRLPINALKLDRCFIRDINNNKNNRIILKHIVALGRELGLQMIAEGVETEHELSVIKALGCDTVQGFYFYKPMPFNEIKKQFDLSKACVKLIEQCA
jgi:diguanylate cyclase (GGDEF)-like protein